MLTREDLESAFLRLGRKALADGKVVEIAVYGGSAILLTFPARAATKDVDAVLTADPAWIRAAAREVAQELGAGWPEDWLNDGVKGWLSHRDAEPGSKNPFGSYPAEDEVGLRVFVAAPEYLFAMKCMAMRIGGVDVTQDRADIELLADRLGIRSAPAAIELVSRFYPSSGISPRTAYGIEEIFSALECGADGRGGSGSGES